MNEQEFTNLLIENIQFQYRHGAYDRSLEIREFAHSISNGVNQEEQVTRGRRFEHDDLKAQRNRLYNPRTKSAIARPRKYWKRVSRVEGIRRTFIPEDNPRVNELINGVNNFMPGKNLEGWLNESLESAGVNDPNRWIIYERVDTRNQEGQIIKTKVWPFLVDSVNALNFSYQYGKLEWLLCRTIEVESVMNGGVVRENILENYFLYFPGGIIRAREIGEKTLSEPYEEIVDIEVFYNQNVKGLPEMGSKKNRAFYFAVIDNGTLEVPAMRCGCYPDEKTGLDCFVPWFDPAEHVFYDLIRNKSSLDVVKTVHTYPRRYEFVKRCTDRDPELGECTEGWYNGIHDEDHRCKVCHGSGRPANFTTEQEVLQLVMPEDTTDLVELSKLAFTEPVDISLPEFLDAQVEADEARVIAAVFDSGLYQKPTDTKTRTATEIDAVMNGIADVLTPFTLLLSQHFELACRVWAQYMEIPTFEVDHSFPDELDIATLAELVASFQSMKDAGVGFEAIAAQRKRVFQKVFEGNVTRQKWIDARYRWLPFDDKSPEEVAMILAARSALDDQRVLRENWLEIFKEIEQETPAFIDMTFDRQKTVVSAKIQEFKSRILLIDQTPVDAMPIADPQPAPAA